jgi:hypothetical protein
MQGKPTALASVEWAKKGSVQSWAIGQLILPARGATPLLPAMTFHVRVRFRDRRVLSYLPRVAKPSTDFGDSFFSTPGFGGSLMSRKFGFAVVALAAAALILSETGALAGRHRRGCGGGGCSTGGCSAGGCASGGCAAAAPAAANSADPQSPAPAATAEADAPRAPAVEPSKSGEVAAAPVTVPTQTYRANRSGRRGLFRR